MDLPPHITASPFPCLEETWNLIFCMKCGISFWQKWYGADRQGSVDDIRSSYNHLCTPNEGFETLKQQWMSLLAAQYSIYCAERWLKIWYFAWTSRAVFTSKWAGLEHEGCVDAAISPSNLAYHSKEGYDILNQQLMSLLAAHHHISPAERIPEIWYFAWKMRVVIGRKDTVWTISGLLNGAIRFSSYHPYIL